MSSSGSDNNSKSNSNMNNSHNNNNNNNNNNINKDNHNNNNNNKTKNNNNDDNDKAQLGRDGGDDHARGDDRALRSLPAPARECLGHHRKGTPGIGNVLCVCV